MGWLTSKDKNGETISETAVDGEFFHSITAILKIWSSKLRAWGYHCQLDLSNCSAMKASPHRLYLRQALPEIRGRIQ